MDTHQLEVFITAAQYLNFTQAAKRLNMVPSAVSHNIAMLESELSTKLFLRNKNKISLTVEGKLFLADAYLMKSHWIIQVSVNQIIIKLHMTEILEWNDYDSGIHSGMKQSSGMMIGMII